MHKEVTADCSPKRDAKLGPPSGRHMALKPGAMIGLGSTGRQSISGGKNRRSGPPMSIAKQSLQACGLKAGVRIWLATGQA